MGDTTNFGTTIVSKKWTMPPVWPEAVLNVPISERTEPVAMIAITTIGPVRPAVERRLVSTCVLELETKTGKTPSQTFICGDLLSDKNDNGSDSGTTERIRNLKRK